jgi:hypothetical protein
MKIIYVAGPFSAPTRVGVEANIALAVEYGIEIARLGGFPLIPHANTTHPEFEKIQAYQFWIEGYRALALGCDAMFMLPDWQTSKGARAERTKFEQLGRPIFENLAELKLWLGGGS